MAKHEGFWKSHGIEITLLILAFFLTALLLQMNSRLSRMGAALESKLNRSEREIMGLKAHVDEQMTLLEENLAQRFSGLGRAWAASERPIFGKEVLGTQRAKAYPRPDQSLDLRTVIDPEIENLALNWGILRRAFPRRLQDSKKAYLDLINQLGFPVTEQQRIQLRKVVHESFGLVECFTTSAGWE